LVKDPNRSSHLKGRRLSLNFHSLTRFLGILASCNLLLSPSRLRLLSCFGFEVRWWRNSLLWGLDIWEPNLPIFLSPQVKGAVFEVNLSEAFLSWAHSSAFSEQSRYELERRCCFVKAVGGRSYPKDDLIAGAAFP